ncbi:hypothetical protein [Halodesulfovibrio sp. MK-HDV]|uniref:hypothetical protein n=1 Tax=Halodesulfovibrio sp. MK-HDV TaxID=2599925 RepID=UPI001C201D8F|nr:hypothetical protein [Halodesulfovibrio sp. MK-HDV]
MRDTASKSFPAGQSINITIYNRGLGFDGVWITVDGSQTRGTGHMMWGSSRTLSFSKLHEIPVPWKVHLMADGAAECCFEFIIRN